MCEIKQINSTNEDVSPQLHYLWYMQALFTCEHFDCEIVDYYVMTIYKQTGLQICFMELNGTTDEHLITCSRIMMTLLNIN